jgi:predicted phage terminase large subunit-like protein
VSLTISNKSWLLDELRKEHLRRELSGSLVKFCEYFFSKKGGKFITSYHHDAIAKALQARSNHNARHLVINMPPRYGKTIMIVHWIAQQLAINPKAQFMYLSYSDTLAIKSSAEVREIIMSNEFQELWKIDLKTDSNSKDQWYTSQGGGMYATSTGGAITGFGAGTMMEDEMARKTFSGAILIDDPIKVDDAFSKDKRDFINDRLNTTIRSRRNNRHVPIIIIAQRVHEEDMSGFALNGGMGEPFELLKLSAIIDGKPLWEAKHTLRELMEQKKSDIFTFSTQMMQDPTPEDGTFFKRDMIKRYRLGQEPTNLYKYGAGDYAVSQGKGDFTEQAIAGISPTNDIWFLDWWSGQTTADEWIKKQISMVKEHEPFIWAAEGGIIRRAIEPFILAEQRKNGVYYRLEWLTSNANKAANARAFQALLSQGKVYIPYCDWGDALVMQLLQFPTGKYDDKVDVCGLIGRLISKMITPANSNTVEPNVAKDGYDMDYNEGDSNNWKTI